MVNYICPICDRKLAPGNYCTLCKKVVRKPIVYDGNMPNQDSHGYTIHHEEMANRLRGGQEAAKANTARELTAAERELYERNSNVRATNGTAMRGHYSNRTLNGGSAQEPASSNRQIDARRKGGLGCLIYLFIIALMILIQLIGRL